MKKDIKDVPADELIDNYTQEIELNKGFEIKCLDCGSKNCEVLEDGEYVDDTYGEKWESYGFYIKCHDCGQDNRI